jgi:hypothetical protein
MLQQQKERLMLLEHKQLVNFYVEQALAKIIKLL